MKIAAFLFKIRLLSSLSVSFPCAQSFLPFNLRSDKDAQEVTQDNEFERNKEGQNDNYYLCNALLLNGQTLDYGNFALTSTGELSLIRSEPESSRSIEIPFYVTLRRNGQILKVKDEDIINKVFRKIEISKILAFAQPGDQLTIDPAQKEDWRAKRILKLIRLGC